MFIKKLGLGSVFKVTISTGSQVWFFKEQIQIWFRSRFQFFVLNEVGVFFLFSLLAQLGQVIFFLLARFKIEVRISETD